MSLFDDTLNCLYSCEETKLSKKEKKILKTLVGNGKMTYYDLLDEVNFKIHSFNKHCDILECLGFITYDEENDTFTSTDIGEQYLFTGKKQHKENREFIKYIESLNDEELEELKKLFENSVVEEEKEEEKPESADQ